VLMHYEHMLIWRDESI